MAGVLGQVGDRLERLTCQPVGVACRVDALELARPLWPSCRPEKPLREDEQVRVAELFDKAAAA